MTVRYHPEFVRDIRRFAGDYQRISPGLEIRFKQEVVAAVAAVKETPEAAGHFLNTGSRVVLEFRRRNLRAFPFFVLYAHSSEWLLFGSLIPNRSDPLTWLTRFKPPV